MQNQEKKMNNIKKILISIFVLVFLLCMIFLLYRHNKSQKIIYEREKLDKKIQEYNKKNSKKNDAIVFVKEAVKNIKSIHESSQEDKCDSLLYRYNKVNDIFLVLRTITKNDSIVKNWILLFQEMDTANCSEVREVTHNLENKMNLYISNSQPGTNVKR